MAIVHGMPNQRFRSSNSCLIPPRSVRLYANEFPQIVSLFCGAGGLDLGFSQAGFAFALALDLSKAAVETHRANFPDVPCICGDIAELGANGIRDALTNRIARGSRIGVIGGPPCQGFSRANVSSTADDPRNKLVIDYLSVVQSLADQYVVDFVVFENVLGIRDAKHARTFRILLDGLNSLGMNVREM